MISNVSKDEMAVATGGRSNFFSRFRGEPNGFIQSSPGAVLKQKCIVTYLFRTAGQVLGVSFSGAILQAVLLQKLRERIHVPDSSKVSEMPFFNFTRPRAHTVIR